MPQKNETKNETQIIRNKYLTNVVVFKSTLGCARKLQHMVGPNVKILFAKRVSPTIYADPVPANESEDKLSTYGKVIISA